MSSLIFSLQLYLFFIFDMSRFLTEPKNMVRYRGPITGRWVRGSPIDHNSKVVIIGSNFESKVFIQSGTFYFLTGCFKIERNIMAYANTSSYNDDYDYILVIMNSKWCIVVDSQSEYGMTTQIT